MVVEQCVLQMLPWGRHGIAAEEAQEGEVAVN